MLLVIFSGVHIPDGEFINDDVNEQKHKQLRREDDRSVELREREGRREEGKET